MYYALCILEAFWNLHLVYGVKSTDFDTISYLFEQVSNCTIHLRESPVQTPHYIYTVVELLGTVQAIIKMFIK